MIYSQQPSFITKQLLAITTLLLCLFSLNIAQADTTQNQTIDKMLDASGFDKLLQHIPDFAQSILKQSSGALEPEINSKLSLAFTRSFKSDIVRRDVIASLRSHYDAKLSAAYLAFTEAERTRQMSKLESATNDPANQQAMMDFINALKNTPATATRSKLIERLDTANRASDFSIDLQTAFFKAVFTAIDPVLENDMKLGTGEMEKMVDEVRQSLTDSTRQRTLHTYLYAFRDLSDSELEEYVSLSEGEGNRWGVQALGNAMIYAINHAAERAANNVSHAAR